MKEKENEHKWRMKRKMGKTKREEQDGGSGGRKMDE